MPNIRTLLAYLVFTFFTSFSVSLPAVPSSSPSLSVIQDSSDLELLQATKLLLSTSDTFPIPKTDLSLNFYHLGPLLDPKDLKSFLLEAGSEIQHQIDQSSMNAASSDRWYNYKSGNGLVLKIWRRSVTLEGYGSLSEVPDVVKGLSLYMMQGKRSRAVCFRSIQHLGATKAVIINIGSVGQDFASSTTGFKREVPPSPLVQYSSTSSVTGPVNESTLNLPTAEDLPIPYTDYSLRLGNLGSQLHPWDLETILIAVSAVIEAEIAAHGRNARLPSSEYSMRLAGLQLWIQRMPWATVNLAWVELAIILDGLRFYIIDGRQDREAFIDVINHVTGTQLAFGWIGKPPRPLSLRRRLEL